MVQSFFMGGKEHIIARINRFGTICMIRVVRCTYPSKVKLPNKDSIYLPG